MTKSLGGDERMLNCSVYQACETVNQEESWGGCILPDAVPKWSQIFPIVPPQAGMGLTTGLPILSGDCE